MTQKVKTALCEHTVTIAIHALQRRGSENKNNVFSPLKRIQVLCPVSSSTSKENPDKLQNIYEGVDLNEALDLLRHADCSDPTLEKAQGKKLLQGVIDALCELSMHDGLTGLSNARYFRIALEREVQRAVRSGETCALFMLDLDHFKKVNDQQATLRGMLSYKPFPVF